ncbi:MAG: hypothetical protein FWG12_03035 [Holophagaceae bacterium]|nr:hypothetical protein [Holophagaceae bacterium]
MPKNSSNSAAAHSASKELPPLSSKLSVLSSQFSVLSSQFSALSSKFSVLSSLLAVLVSSVACYRATGYDRAALIAQEIPAVGGDRVPGLKSMAGAGDYFVGNDFVALAVDGTPLSELSGIAGAVGGGSIVDVGFISLDTSYRRVPMPCDMLDRMTTVINQDPDISAVFHEFGTINEIGKSSLVMHGWIHDPAHKLLGASWDDRGFVHDVSITTTISLGSLDRRFGIETTVANHRSSSVGIRSIGDLIYQRGGGFRILAPVCADKDGVPLSTWGVNLPGTDFSDPLSNSVRSGPVTLMGTEPGADTLDCHITLGLLPWDAKQFLVASDPQDSLGETRPVFPERFVAGSLDSGIPLGSNETLTHKRYLYVKGGTSGAAEYTFSFYTQSTPNQATGILNEMFVGQASMNETKIGLLNFTLEGTALRSGPIPAELRFERYIGEGDPATDEDSANWLLERLEWMEPMETTEYYSDYYYTPTSSFGVFLPEGTYRIVSKNAHQSTTMQVGTNVANEDRPGLQAPIVLDSELPFVLSERISPERSDVLSPYGSRVAIAQSGFSITARGSDSLAGFIQPMRFSAVGLDGLPDPAMRRNRSITSIYDPTARYPRPTVSLPGSFHFAGGNSAFGVQLTNALVIWTVPGRYQAYGSRGPLSTLESFIIDSRPGLGTSGRGITVFQTPLPEGWIAFDTPGPSMASSGGMLPCEQLSSAMAEAINIVARTEIDLQTDADKLQDEFQAEIAYEEDYIEAVGTDPMVVGARTSNLEGYGAITAYFTPFDPEGRNGGARPSRGWTLADFLAQADGKYNVIHRPRGPQGAFTKLGFDPGLPLSAGAPWWHLSGPLSLGLTNGQFDAIEIISAGTVASSGVDVWWSEYKALRNDWFAILCQQLPDSYTKALGFSSGRFSQDTPVGLARTYLNIGSAELSQDDLEPVLLALKTGAAVASTGPLLDIAISAPGTDAPDGVGPGGLVAIGGSPAFITLNVTMLATDWMPVDELRVIVNGKLALTVPDPKSVFEQSEEDYRHFTGTIQVPLPASKDAWLVVEAGASLDAAGPYRQGTPWSVQMKGIYPIAITNPIFLSLTPGPYLPPGL